MNTKPTLLLILLGIFTAVLGCGEDAIHSYDAPKDSSQPHTDEHAGHNHASTPAPNAPPKISWTLPAGWTQKPGSGMRFATLFINTTPPLEVRVSPLGMAAAQTLGNVQRWAGMIGMPPVTQQQLPNLVTTINVQGFTTDIINLNGPAKDDQPAQQTLAAILRNPPTVWFFAVTGSADQLAPHQKAFEDLIKSIRFTSPDTTPDSTPDTTPDTTPIPTQASPTADTPAPPTTTKDNKLIFQAPASWRKDPAPNNMRIASFIIDNENATTGEVAITRFPGDVGGLLANVNRWRAQVSLPTIDAIDKQEVNSTQVDGLPAMAMDLIEPDEESSEAKRMIVILLPHNNMTWFFKMTGPSDLLEKQKAAFAAFIHSIRFTGDDS